MYLALSLSSLSLSPSLPLPLPPPSLLSPSLSTLSRLSLLSLYLITIKNSFYCVWDISKTACHPSRFVIKKMISVFMKYSSFFLP